MKPYVQLFLEGMAEFALTAFEFNTLEYKKPRSPVKPLSMMSLE